MIRINMSTSLKYFERLREELDSLGKILFNTNRKLLEIIFFSTQAQYIAYYEGLLDELVETHKKTIVYLTSDESDLSLRKKMEQIVPCYSKSFLPLILPAIDSSVLVTTIPDLNQYKVKRSFFGTNYVYMFHSLVSTHMMYRKGAFDFYDTIFCAGPHHVAEIRRTEELYGLPPKALHEVGYYRLEKIYKQHHDHTSNQDRKNSSEKMVLIAPSWHESNILNTCVEDLTRSFLAEGFQVVVRPHPMTIAKSPDILAGLKHRFKGDERFRVDVETSSETYLHQADMMICDWSGVALEYAFGTERPVLFIDLPRKIYNPEYEKLGIEPLEAKIRDQIGKQISPGQAGNAGKIARDFIDRADDYRQQIIACREANIYNFGKSSTIGAEIIMTILKDEKKGRAS